MPKATIELVRAGVGSYTMLLYVRGGRPPARVIRQVANELARKLIPELGSVYTVGSVDLVGVAKDYYLYAVDILPEKLVDEREKRVEKEVEW